MMLFLLAALVGILPWILLFIVLRQQGEIRKVTERLERLERLGPVAHPAQPAIPAAPLPRATPPSTAAPAPAPLPLPARSVAPAPATAPAPTPAPRRHDPTRLEQQIGGVWMQNVGSVLLLLGAFFLIVWGYATGRIGPGILVLAGVLLGAVVVWRGDVIARSLRALGNALIGVGLGTIYITLYVGHFQMRVLPQWAAFAALTVVALVTVAIGLRRRQPIIATLGVIGAFVPQLMAVWIPLQGFRLPLPTLLAYFAVVNGVVFILAATVGWSGLAIFSMILTAGTWAANAHGAWGLPIQLGLTSLFAALGLAPVLRLARSPAAVRNIDLLVVALAPLLYLLCSIPYLVEAGRTQAAWLLGALAVLYIGVAIWVESGRERRDLWKPLTGAATLFLTAALERGIDPEHLAMAWSAEGAVLIALGLGKGRDFWLRLLGYGVAFLSGCWLTYAILGHWAAGAGGPGPFGVAALRDLFCVCVLLIVAHLIGRRRDLLSKHEGWAPGVAAVTSNLLLMIWIAREAGRLREVLPGISGSEADRVTWVLASAAWLIQALTLVALGGRPGAAVLRHTGYIVGGAGALGLWVAYEFADVSRPAQPPFLNTAALAMAIGIAVMMACSEFLWRGRDRLGNSERRMPEVVAGAANGLLLLWWAREATNLAAVLGSASGGAVAGAAAIRTLAAILTSAAWTLQAIALFAIGWIRNSAYLRWSGLVLFGLTVVKFLAVDLDRVDAFWRFVGAVGIGGALLVVSFLYQRRGRRGGDPQPEPEAV